MKRPYEPVSLSATAEPTRDDVLFFAGFYDGEGSVQGRANGSCTMQLVQKDTELLHKARALWGGSIHLNNRGISHWVLSGDRARKFLIAIYPYLSTRRKAQLENAGALKLTGKPSSQYSGLTSERAAARAKMTDAERHSETCIRWAKSNPEKVKEISDRHREKNREIINQRQRERRALAKLKSYTPQEETLGRSTLVN